MESCGAKRAKISLTEFSGVWAYTPEQEMKAQNLNKTKMAKKMRPSRAALNRLLDENDTSLTLTTLASAATVLGKTLKVGLAVA